MLFFVFASSLYPQESLKIPSASPDVPYVEREEKEFNFYPGGKLTIAAGAVGNVSVLGWQKGSIRMEAEKIVHNLPPEKAKTIIGKNPLKVKWDQTSATIRTSGNPALETAMEVNLTVYVPRDKTDLIVRIIDGNFSVELVNGWVEATILQGDIEVKSVAGYFSAVTQKGDVRADMPGKRWSGREFAAVTQAGNINLLLPIDYSAALQLETRNGKISVDYPDPVVDNEVKPLDILIQKKSQVLKAEVGGGGAAIKLATSSGDVTLSKKPAE